MKKLCLFLIISVSLFSCNNNEGASTVNNPAIEVKDASGYFPVTGYLKGQIAEIKNNGVNPIRIVSINGKPDSAWLKMEQLDSVFAVFLTPVIDSANMTGLFKEDKFHDQTLNSITFIYEPRKQLPADMLLKRWDVYIQPETGRVKRIYMEKYTADKKEIQLSWEPKKAARIVLISTDAAGKATVEKEELVKWNFEEEVL